MIPELRRLTGVAVLLLWAATGHGAPPPAPGTPEGSLSFAETLLRGEDSFRAATEFLRFLHHYPQHPQTPAALEGLGRSYALADRFDDAASAFGQMLRTAPEPGDRDRARWLLGSALYRGGRYSEAMAALRSDQERDAEEAERFQVMSSLAYLRSGADPAVAPGLRRDLLDEFSALERKNPAAAGFLAAILPGLGHLYVERPRDAVVSLALNSVFLWGTYEAVRRDQWALAGILGFFELGWYSGNIVSAANGAHKWNRREEGRFFSRWEAVALPRWQLVLAPGHAGALARWEW